MNRLTMLILAGVVLMAGGARTLAGGAMTVGKLRCEYLVEPVGIDVVEPRLSWVLSSNERGQVQTAYRVRVATSPDQLRMGRADLWDSGKVRTDQSVHVVYRGKPLHSQMRCFWSVRVWDGQDRPTAWSKSALWTMGLLEPSDWRARWIGLDGGDEQKPDSEHTRLPARMLRKEFRIDKAVRRATVYVSGLGFFELYLNGRRVGDHVMDPGLTMYTRRAFYVTHEVAERLNLGVNAIGVILGNGRYFAPRKAEPWSSTHQFGYPKLRLQMHIEYADGSIAEVRSDQTWRLTTNGPIRANNEYDGEYYDARMEMDDWAKPAFRDDAWQPARRVEPPGGVLEAQMIEPMRVTQTIRPVAITNPKPGVYLVDMGQVFYGTVRLKVTGPAGTRVQMRSAYNLTPAGLLKMADNRSALSTDVYILKGEGVETWQPRFRGQGFRFVEVTGFPDAPTVDDFEGRVIHTDMKPVGSFVCSNRLINQIHSNIRWGQRMYRRSVPMDPDRDERLGWLGDPAKDSASDACNFNVAPLYAKWLADVRLDQRPSGEFPDVSPNYYPVYTADVVWPSVMTIIPEWYHDFYGDRRILGDNYDSVKRWMHFLRRHLKPDFTVDHCRYGDWCDAYSMDGQGPLQGKTCRPLISTAYYYNNCRIMSRMAQLLGKPDDETRFAELAGKIKTGFNKRFFNPAQCEYESDTQCAYVLALKFGLVPDKYRAGVIANLVNDIMVKRDGHLSVGLVGMQWLMQTLSEMGHPEVAYTIATQTSRPSWGYMIANGATAIWERWDTNTQSPGMNSEALLMLAGNLDAWFYETLAGINRDAERPGFKHVVLRPNPVGDLRFVKARYDSMYGRIASEWTSEEGRFTWNVVVPANTTATVYIPAASGDRITEGDRPASDAEGVTFVRTEEGAAVYRIGSGHYAFAKVAPGR